MSDENLDDTTIARTPAQEAAASTATDSAPLEPVTDAAPADTTDDAVPAVAPQYGIGPFSLREVILGGVWLVAFVVSFFPINIVVGQAAVLVGGPNVWVSGLTWILAIGLPTAAVFLLALRRLSPQGIRRVGSLGIDQFASVAFSVAAITWVAWVWETTAIALQIGIWARSWVIWVEAVLMIAGVVLTVFAFLIPGLSDDFRERPEAAAHRNARAPRPLTPRPVRERPVHTPAPTHDTGAQPGYAAGAYATGAQPTYDTGAQPTYDSGAYDTGAVAPAESRDLSATDVFAPLHTDSGAYEPLAQEPVDAEQEHAAQAPAPQAFWALVPVERDVVDDYGNPIFRIGPTAWALVIEDRGEAFVVRHEDGRIGYLHDVTGVTRG